VQVEIRVESARFCLLFFMTAWNIRIISYCSGADPARYAAAALDAVPRRPPARLRVLVGRTGIEICPPRHPNPSLSLTSQPQPQPQPQPLPPPLPLPLPLPLNPKY
jgi:hypothetical protein